MEEELVNRTNNDLRKLYTNTDVVLVKSDG